ncbi:MAG: Gfo/Idh/MocA family oxidoreductase [Thermomicrobiales bacterium]
MPRLAIAGCGIMGRRHVRGLAQLRQIGNRSFELVAVCDPVCEAAAALADLAALELGSRPLVCSSLSEALAKTAIDALDITTAPALHPVLASEAFAAGLHVLVEKPIALTVRAGQAMVEAARGAGRVLAVAENYRRDPINRLARALIVSGAIGRPYLAMQTHFGWGERVIITPWRHQRASGGIAVDMGVHYADMLEYLLGPVESVGGMGSLVDTVRIGPQGEEHAADADDVTVGIARFASGAVGSWTLNFAGRGEETFSRVIHGTEGTIALPRDRTGQPIQMMIARGGRVAAIDSAGQLDLLPDFALDATAAALFGGERIGQYELPWADVDAKLLAIELDDFARAIETGVEAEVTGEQGVRSLAIAYGFFESERTGRMLTVAQLLDGRNSPYQGEIDAAPVGGAKP